MIRQFLAKLNTKESIVYAIFFAMALVYVVASYGVGVVLKTSAVLFCMIAIIRNLVLIYVALRRYGKNRVQFLDSKDLGLILASSIAVMLLFIFFLSRKWQNAILIFCSIILLALLSYDLLRGYTKK